MAVTLIDKKIKPLMVRFKINYNFKDEPALLIWEDSLSKNISNAGSSLKL